MLLMHDAQLLLAVSHEKPLDDRLQLASVSHAVFGVELPPLHATSTASQRPAASVVRIMHVDYHHGRGRAQGGYL